MRRQLLLSAILCFFCFIASGQYCLSYTAAIGGVPGGEVNSKTFSMQRGLVAERFVSGNHWYPILVDSFKVIHIRRDDILFQYSNKGSYFDSILVSHFKGLMSGDRILIYDIRATDVGNKKVFLHPLEFRMR
jgi:hypothetical protein